MTFIWILSTFLIAMWYQMIYVIIFILMNQPENNIEILLTAFAVIHV